MSILSGPEGPAQPRVSPQTLGGWGVGVGVDRSKLDRTQCEARDGVMD